MQVRRLSTALGAEVTGLDVSGPLADEQFAAVHRALCESNGVLVIRDQVLSPQQQVDFSRRFGELFGEAEPLQRTVDKYLLPGFPQLLRISNKKAAGEPQGRERAGNYWHSDVSFRLRPAKVSVLYAIEVPRLGGDTLFCSMYSAFAALSAPLRNFLEGLRARHDFAVNTRVGFTRETISEGDLDGANAALHPVVRVHGDTGRKCLFVNPGNTSHVEGLAPRESAGLLRFLYHHCVRPEFLYRHRWSVNDLVIWDNRCTMHYAMVDYDDDRYLHRTTVIGECPLPPGNETDRA